MVGEEEEKPPSPAAVVQVQVRAELLLLSFFACVIQVLHSNVWSENLFLFGMLFFFSLSRC